MKNAKKIKLYWYGGNSKTKNFGDEISPYIIRKLSGKNVIFRKPTFVGFIHQLFDSIFVEFNLRLFFNLLRSFTINEKIILGAGSIAAISNKKTIIWGAGLMVPYSTAIYGEVKAVRGNLTAKILHDNGIIVNKIVGDPGLLLPIVYRKVRAEKSKQIGIIPHFSEFKFFEDKYSNNYKIIDLATSDVEKVIDEICECGYTLSSSLHGIIVSHAYGIPAIWIEKNVLETSGFKFKDYFSSVNISEYQGFNNVCEIVSTQENIISFFTNNRDIALPNININDLQHNLINEAPFTVLEILKHKFE